MKIGGISCFHCLLTQICNQPVSDSCPAENALLMPEVRGEWPDSFELLGRQQPLKYSLITTKKCRRASLSTQHAEPAEGATPGHQNETTEDWKNAAWCDVSVSAAALRRQRQKKEELLPSDVPSKVLVSVHRHESLL